MPRNTPSKFLAALQILLDEADGAASVSASATAVTAQVSKTEAVAAKLPTGQSSAIIGGKKAPSSVKRKGSVWIDIRRVPKSTLAQSLPKKDRPTDILLRQTGKPIGRRFPVTADEECVPLVRATNGKRKVSVQIEDLGGLRTFRAALGNILRIHALSCLNPIPSNQTARRRLRRRAILRGATAPTRKTAAGPEIRRSRGKTVVDDSRQKQDVSMQDNNLVAPQGLLL